MSYCRWSTDDFNCDLYCYYSVGDFFATHVAGNRIHWFIEIPPKVQLEFFKNGKIKKGSLKRWSAREVKFQRLLDDQSLYERRPIGLRYDGETFEDATEQEFIDTLTLLRDAGYRFPYERIVASIKDEMELATTSK